MTTEPVGTGTRQTWQRAAIRDLLASLSEFRSAQQVHELLSRSERPVGLATVYRCLQTMADAGELDVIVGIEGEQSYRWCSGGHHHHLVCRHCGKTVEVQTKTIEEWTRTIAEKYGFVDVVHNFELFGVCEDCA